MDTNVGTMRREEILLLEFVAFLVFIAVIQVADGAAATGVAIPPALEGDQATYKVEGTSEPAFAFQWLPREPTHDRWGDPFEADVLRVLVENPQAGTWSEDHVAFAGVSHDPIWRRNFEERTTNQVNPGLGGLGQVPSTSHDNVSATWFAPQATYRTCFAHHGLQGRVLQAGDRVLLPDFCPAVMRYEINSMSQPARETTWRGHAAVELSYDIESFTGATGDVPFPAHEGWIRVTFADGHPFVVAWEMGGIHPEDAGRYLLHGFLRGEGEAVRPWLNLDDPEPRTDPDARFAPLGRYGPRDGRSGLAYPLEQAVEAVLQDPWLQDFHAWLDSRPDHFLLVADLTLYDEFAPVSGEVGTSQWRLSFASPMGPGVMDVYTVQTLRHDAQPLPAGLQPPIFGGPGGAQEERATWNYGGRAPLGEASIDFASALRAFGAHRPPSAAAAPVTRVIYHAPQLAAETGDAGNIRVEGSWSAPGPEYNTHDFGATFVSATGAAWLLDAYDQEVTWGAFALTLEPQTLSSTSTATAAPPPLPQIEVLSLGLFALLALALAQAGYLTVAYSRLRGSELLNHAPRRRLYELVKARPGIHFGALVEDGGLGVGGTMYNMAVLERGGLVTHVALPRFKRYYLTGSLPTWALRGAAELEAGSARAVYDAIRARPDITLREVAQGLNVSDAAAYKTIERLRRAGLVEKKSDGRFVRLVAKPFPEGN